mgnify:CR=1 FL=1
MFDKLRQRLHEPSSDQHPIQLTETPGFKSVVYFSNWSVYQRKHFAIDIPVRDVTHIMYAFISIDVATGRLKFTDEWCDLQLPMVSPKSPDKKVLGSHQQLFQMKQLNPNLKVVMSVGGWGTDHMFQAISQDRSKLHNFVDSCGEFVTEYGFDGIDIDWEYPRNHEENNSLIELLKGVREKLNTIAPDLSLSIAAPGGDDNIAVLDLKSLDKYLSFWNLMCYDFAGNGWSTKTGFHSNLFGNNGDNNLSVESVVSKYVQGGINSRKLVVGMPAYGRAFHGATFSTIGSAFTKEKPRGCTVESDTIDYCKLPIGQEDFDAKKVGALCYSSEQKCLITYDNVRSVRIKAKYIELNRLGGGMWWDSAGDSKDPSLSLVSNFVDQLGGAGALEQTGNHLSIYGKSKYLHELVK